MLYTVVVQVDDKEHVQNKNNNIYLAFNKSYFRTIKIFVIFIYL